MRLVTFGLAATLLAGIGSAFFLYSQQGPVSAPRSAVATVSAPAGCAAVPHACGFPDATTTGVPSGMALKTVPGQVSSGPGWRSAPDGSVKVTGNGAVLSGLSIHGNLDITASNVTIKNDQVTTAGLFGISLRHTVGVLIENSSISGTNAAGGRVSVAIDDVYGDSTGMVIASNNIWYAKTGVQVSTGLVTSNYLHGFGYVAGDHTNGIFDAGSTQPLMIYHNTILNNYGQTDAVSLNATGAGQPVANKSVEGNLLAGGSYTIYGGNSHNNPISNIIIEDNTFSQAYYAKGGQYGPIAYFGQGKGNGWSGNTWDITGQIISLP
jgi:hypothetical protein